MPDDKIVEVPGIGNVEFPASMSDDDISSAIAKQLKANSRPDFSQNPPPMPKPAASTRGGTFVPLGLMSGAQLSQQPNESNEAVAEGASRIGQRDRSLVTGITKGALNKVGLKGILGNYLEPADSQEELGKIAYQTAEASAPAAGLAGIGRGMGLLGLGLRSAAEGATTGGMAALQGNPDAAKMGLLGAAAVPAAEGAAAAIKALPSAKRAGAAINEITRVAREMPVDPNPAGTVALDAMKDDVAGATAPKVIKRFIARTTDPDSGPLTFEEGRRFYKTASRLSTSDISKATPDMRRKVAMFANELGNSLQDTATAAGRPDYADQLAEYHQAKVIQSVVKKGGQLAAKSVPYTILGIPLGYMLKSH